MRRPLTEVEIQERLNQHPDLLERFRSGDLSALTELFEVCLGATVTRATVRQLS